ncbi:MAG: choice-of-anchor L domain-containing protein [Cyanobacteria bacterium P01_H01_bin.58]
MVFALTVMAAPAQAFNIRRNSNPNALLNVLLGDTTGLSNIQVRANGHPSAFGTFNNDPFGLGSGIVLTTGNVNQLSGFNQRRNDFTDGADVNTSLPGYDNEAAGLFDITQLIISFDVDDFVNRLFFEYAFGSEEFPEWAGSRFNDFFTLQLNGQNLALLNHSVGSGRRVSVNNLLSSPNGIRSRDYVNNPRGVYRTRLDGFTRPLTFQGNLQPGRRNVLRIFIADVADERLDSAVFLKAQTLGTVRPDQPVPTPEPEPPTPEPEPPTPEPEPPVPEPEPPTPEPEPPVPDPVDGTDDPAQIPEPGLVAGLFGIGLLGLRQRLASKTAQR